MNKMQNRKGKHSSSTGSDLNSVSKTSPEPHRNLDTDNASRVTFGEGCDGDRNALERKSPDIADLPAPILSAFCRCLSRRDLLSFSGTCKTLRSVALSTPGCWRSLCLHFSDNKFLRMKALAAVAPYVYTLRLVCITDDMTGTGFLRLTKAKFRGLPIFPHVTKVQMSSFYFRGGEQALLGILANVLPGVKIFEYMIEEKCPVFGFIDLVHQTWPDLENVELSVYIPEEQDDPEPDLLFDDFLNCGLKIGEAKLLSKLDIDYHSFSGIDTLARLWRVGVKERLTSLSVRAPAYFDIPAMGGISGLNVLTTLSITGRVKSELGFVIYAFSRNLLEQIRDISTLKSLTLIGDAQYDDCSWAAMFGGAKFSLTSLHLLTWHPIKRKTAEALVSTQSGLETVHVSWIGEGEMREDAKTLIQSMPNLKKFTAERETRDDFFSESDEEANPESDEEQDEDEFDHYEDDLKSLFEDDFYDQFYQDADDLCDIM